MKVVKLIASGALVPLALAGCATVINGTSQDYQMDSKPTGARVTLSNGQNCVAPCSITLKRRNDLQATYELAGYKSETVYIQSRTGGAVAGNLLLGGLVGGVVDASNGATNTLYPRPLFVQLIADGASGEASILDKKGEVISTIAVHNAKVKADVEKGLAAQTLKATKRAERAEKATK